MGAGNVKAVYANWGHLDDRPFRLLTFMAVTIPDANDPPLWYGGPEVMAVGLGIILPEPQEGDPKVTACREAAFRAVRRALKANTKAGALTLIRRSAPGRAPMWRANFTPATPDAQRPLTASDDSPTPDAQRSEHRTLDVGTPDAQRSNTGRSASTSGVRGLQGLGEEEMAAVRTDLPVVRARDPEQPPKEQIPGEETKRQPAPTTRAQQAIAEAMARREQARRAHTEGNTA